MWIYPFFRQESISHWGYLNANGLMCYHVSASGILSLEETGQVHGARSLIVKYRMPADFRAGTA